MKTVEPIVRWLGVLSSVVGLSCFIGSLNSAYTARSMIEAAGSLSETAALYNLHDVLRALDLFQMGVVGLLIAGACFGVVYYLSRSIRRTADQYA